MKGWDMLVVAAVLYILSGCQGRATLTERAAKSFEDMAAEYCEEKQQASAPCACEFFRAAAETIRREKLPDVEQISVLPMLDGKPENHWDVTTLLMVRAHPRMIVRYHGMPTASCMPVNDPAEYVASLRTAIEAVPVVEQLDDEATGRQKT